MLHKKGRIVLLLTLFVGLFMGTFLYKSEVVFASVAMSPDGHTCTPCHTPDWGEKHGITPPAGSTTAAPTTPTAAPTTPKVQYVPELYKPVDREANNALFGGGLGLGAVVIGGAIFLDKRKK